MTPPHVSVDPSVVAPVDVKVPLQVKLVDNKAAQVVTPVTERVDNIATALPKLNPPVAVNVIRLLFMVTRIRAVILAA